MKQSDIAMVGLAVMGENLALNMESKGYTVTVYNRPPSGSSQCGGTFYQWPGKRKEFSRYGIDSGTGKLTHPSP